MARIIAHDNREYNETKDLANAIKLSAEFLTTVTHKYGLYICGTLGNGKTTLARSIRRFVADMSQNGESSYYYIPENQRIWFVTAEEIVRPFISGDKPEGYQRLFKDKFVFIDDVGREPNFVNVYGTRYCPIADLLSARYDDKQVRTIITTNLTPSEFAERYGERVYDRIKESYIYIPFRDESFR